MNSKRFLIQSSLFGLGISILGGSEDKSSILIGHGDDDHAVMLFIMTLFQTPNVMRFMGRNSIELLDFETLLDNTKVATSDS